MHPEKSVIRHFWFYEKCFSSEIGCDLSLSALNNNNKSPTSHLSSSSRKNKRKNFKPRNILEYAGSDEEAGDHPSRPQLHKYHKAKPHRGRIPQRTQQYRHEEDNDDEDNEIEAPSPSGSSLPEKVNGTGTDLRMDLDGEESDDSSEEYRHNSASSPPVDGPLDLSDVQDCKFFCAFLFSR